MALIPHTAEQLRHYHARALQRPGCPRAGARETLGPPAHAMWRHQRDRWHVVAWWLVPAARPAVILGLFLIAWIPRHGTLNSRVTIDERNWMRRAVLFAQAIEQHRPRETYQKGHPGVTTMWAVLLGLSWDQVRDLAPTARSDRLEQAPGYLDRLRQARATFALLTALLVVVLASLTWRLFGAAPGLTLGLLLALDPFFLAHSSLVHLDALLTGWMAIAVLSGLVYWWRRGALGYLVVCGLATGLAGLTKTPAVLLLVTIPCLAITAHWVGRHRTGGVHWRRLGSECLIWAAIAGTLAMLLWPALWLYPLETLARMIAYTAIVSGEDHLNFFLGQAVDDPGPLFYPVALAFRSTPVTMVGLALLLFGLVRHGPAGLPRAWRWPLATLVASSLLFGLVLTVVPKKADRYILPVVPALGLLAACGYTLALRWIRQRARRALAVLAGLTVVVSQIWTSRAAHPYYLAYYNPLLGGGPAAVQVLRVGWGEGLDLVAAHLNAKPRVHQLRLTSSAPRVLQAQFDGQVVDDAAQADYVVHYVTSMQRHTDPEEHVVQPPELVVVINGIEYARLYRTPLRAVRGRSASSG